MVCLALFKRSQRRQELEVQHVRSHPRSGYPDASDSGNFACFRVCNLQKSWGCPTSWIMEKALLALSNLLSCTADWGQRLAVFFLIWWNTITSGISLGLEKMLFVNQVISVFIFPEYPQRDVSGQEVQWMYPIENETMGFLFCCDLKEKVLFFARQKLMHAWTSRERFRWISVKSCLFKNKFP